MHTRVSGVPAYAAIVCAALVVVASIRPASTQGRGGAAAPAYRVQPFWPQPFPNQSWVFGSITGVTVDAQNHVWVVHRGADSLEANEKGMMQSPPTAALCCVAAPFVLEFDQAGEILKQFPDRLRNDVILRIATLDGVQPAALKELNEALARMLAGASTVKKASMGGVRHAASGGRLDDHLIVKAIEPDHVTLLEVPARVERTLPLVDVVPTE